jgi:23S rRNA pseudouridine2457 synthase
MLVLFNKPFDVLCQFTDRSDPPRRTLAEFGLPPGVYPAGRLDRDSEGRDAALGGYVGAHPPRRRAPAQGSAGRRHPPRMVSMRKIYPAGRLDYDSEGLVLLTDDGALAHRITDPRHASSKTYIVQVEGEPDDAALHKLRTGIVLKDGVTRPAQARVLPCAPDWLWPREPPVRFRKSVPDAWLELTIREGRNRQVRRMTAAAGLPTLRLVRVRIGEHALDGLQPGAFRIQDPVPARRHRPDFTRSTRR